MWCIAWETQQGFCCFLCRAIERRRGCGEEAVITNSIHFRNNNTALSANHDLFSSGSCWSAPAKISTHLPLLAVTSQNGTQAWPPAAALSVSFRLCTHEHSSPCTCMWDSELLVGWGQNCQHMEMAGSIQSEDALQATMSGFIHWKVFFLLVVFFFLAM